MDTPRYFPEFPPFDCPVKKTFLFLNHFHNLFTISPTHQSSSFPWSWYFSRKTNTSDKGRGWIEDESEMPCHNVQWVQTVIISPGPWMLCWLLLSCLAASWIEMMILWGKLKLDFHKLTRREPKKSSRKWRFIPHRVADQSCPRWIQ